MDHETLSHIFEPFYTTKPAGKGTGLGLATVYGIVEQNRGSISVTSEPGNGTTFRIYLPRLEEPQGEAAPDAALIAGKGIETILVVEDEAMLRRLICKVLRNHGYEVLDAANADEGLRACQEHPGRIELLLTDVVMPGRSGRELALFASSRYPDMKVIYMSGYTDDAVVRHGVFAAEVHFLQKPFSPSDLAQTVRNVLDQ
jgi:CheY-like chemotaxis protein